MYENERPYLECFFICMSDGNDGFALSPIRPEVYRALENVVAEIAVPCNRPEATYGLVVMIVYKLNHELALQEMASIQADACRIVDEYRQFFFDPSEA